MKTSPNKGLEVEMHTNLSIFLIWFLVLASIDRTPYDRGNLTHDQAR